MNEYAYTNADIQDMLRTPHANYRSLVHVLVRLVDEAANQYVSRMVNHCEGNATDADMTNWYNVQVVVQCKKITDWMFEKEAAS